VYVIGTAGHVDHGKSTLIRALTGIDPDRLQEEKARGMTIDLGFAWLKLPGGDEVSIVDVPGHERFIKNMLAGVGGIDLALLVIAADEGVMPQTREHLAILDLLQIKSGVVALTKVDLVETDWLALVQEDVAGVLAGTSLAGAPLVPVSAVTGVGLKELVQTIQLRLQATPPKRDLGRPRLAVDRVFTVAGFGTVVTGTLIDGKLRLGQEIEVVRVGRAADPVRARVRGLQSHKRKVEEAWPGSRVAVNLSGVTVDDLQRGDVITTPGWLRTTTLVDVRLRAIADLPKAVEHNIEVSVHTGAAEVQGQVSLLAGDQLAAGQTAWAQLRLREPLAVAKSDFVIIRSPNATLAGGQIVEPYAPRRRRKRPEVIAALETLAQGTPQEIVLQALAAGPPLEMASLVEKAHLPVASVETALTTLLASGEVVRLDVTPTEQGGNRSPSGSEPGAPPLTSRTLIVSATGWREWTARALAAVGNYHRQYPLRVGIPKEELKSRLGQPVRVFNESLAHWLRDGKLTEAGATIRLPDHTVQFTPAQQAKVERLLAQLATNPYTPPSRSEMEQATEPEVIASLLEQGRLVKVNEALLFSKEAYEEMVSQVIALLKSQGKITAAEVRDRFNTSRKYAIGLLEHLDELRITRRVGDERVLY